MNSYKIIYDGDCSYIHQLDYEVTPDGYAYFNNPTKAKKALKKYLNAMAKNYRDAAKCVDSIELIYTHEINCKCKMCR